MIFLLFLLFLPFLLFLLFLFFLLLFSSSLTSLLLLSELTPGVSLVIFYTEKTSSSASHGLGCRGEGLNAGPDPGIAAASILHFPPTTVPPACAT